MSESKIDIDEITIDEYLDLFKSTQNFNFEEEDFDENVLAELAQIVNDVAATLQMKHRERSRQFNIINNKINNSPNKCAAVLYLNFAEDDNLLGIYPAMHFSKNLIEKSKEFVEDLVENKGYERDDLYNYIEQKTVSKPDNWASVTTHDQRKAKKFIEKIPNNISLKDSKKIFTSMQGNIVKNRIIAAKYYLEKEEKEIPLTLQKLIDKNLAE